MASTCHKTALSGFITSRSFTDTYKIIFCSCPRLFLPHSLWLAYNLIEVRSSLLFCSQTSNFNCIRKVGLNWTEIDRLSFSFLHNHFSCNLIIPDWLENNLRRHSFYELPEFGLSVGSLRFQLQHMRLDNFDSRFDFKENKLKQSKTTRTQIFPTQVLSIHVFNIYNFETTLLIKTYIASYRSISKKKKNCWLDCEILWL